MQFWHTTFRHAVFLSNFRVARFYNCTFIDCVFAHTGFYGAILEKVRFLDCEFIEEDSFTACDLTAVEFRQCFMPHRLFYDCRFDAATTVEDSSDRPHRTTPSGDLRPKAELTNVYKGIKEGYVAGDVPHLARRFFFRQRQAATRYNSRNRQEKAVGLFQEFVAGYGIRPERPLAAMALVLVLSLAVFLFAMTPTDAFLLATGALFTFGANTDALKRLGPAYKLIYVATAFLGISLTALFITVLANVWFRERL